MSFTCKISTVLLLVFSTTIASAQSGTPNRYFEFGFNTNSYKGDLSHSYTNWSNGIHFGVLFNKKKRFNGHFNLMVGSAIAENANYFFDDGSDPQPTPNKFARIKMIAANYDLHLNLYKKNRLTVYLYQGIGILRIDPRDQGNTKLIDQLNTRAQGETYSNISIFLPHGIGAHYTSKIGFGAGFQAGFMNTTTDYIDNVSKWGDRSKGDNILVYKLNIYVPFPSKKSTPSLPTK